MDVLNRATYLYNTNNGNDFLVRNFGLRFHFNGKENDDETKTQDYGLRIYSGDLGRFLSVDPLAKDFAWNSTYCFAENSPVEFIDLDGGEKSRPQQLSCTDFTTKIHKPMVWPKIQLIRTEVVREQAEIYNRTVSIKEPEPGVKTKKDVSIGNSEKTIINYDMVYVNSDKLEVLAPNKETIINTGFVSGTGSYDIDTKYTKLTVRLTPSGEMPGSTYLATITHNDVRVFEQKKTYFLGIKILTSKVKMLSAQKSKTMIKYNNQQEIQQSDELKNKFEKNNDIEKKEDYFENNEKLKKKYE